MIELPTRFRFDSSGEIAEVLSCPENVMGVISSIETELESTRCPGFLTGSAGLVIPEHDDTENQLRHSAFYQAGAMVLAGFFESDIPTEYKSKTIAQLALRQVPMCLLQNTFAERMEAMRDFALQSLSMHSELRPITEPVLEYHIETFQTDKVGDCSIAGAGFTAYQLDRAWEEVQFHMLNKDVDTIDWDTFEQG